MTYDSGLLADDPRSTVGLDGPAGLDLERLEELRDLDPGSTAYLDRAIDNFEVNSAAAVAEVVALAGRRDLEGVRPTAHKIAGSALNLGARSAGEVARAVELHARDGHQAEVDGLLRDLADAMAEGRGLLRRYQATYR